MEVERSIKKEALRRFSKFDAPERFVMIRSFMDGAAFAYANPMKDGQFVVSENKLIVSVVCNNEKQKRVTSRIIKDKLKEWMIESSVIDK